MHLKLFRIGYRNSQWLCRFGDVELVFPYYPYLAFQDIEGYLADSRFIPRLGQTVIDIGGCYGEYALLASRLVGPSGRVIMVEPDAANLRKAFAVFEMNGSPTNIQVFHGAVSDVDGRAAFQTGFGPESALAVGGAERSPLKPGDNTGQTVEVEVVTLASLVERFCLQEVDIVKMDVEGAELGVVRGASRLPSHINPRYAIASYHMVDGQKTADALPALFAACDYECSTGNPAHLTTWAWPRVGNS
ncbi:MAG: FkbM family methyltransferase [Planctomycetota bacterium]